jgi:hypothetical protein
MHGSRRELHDATRVAPHKKRPDHRSNRGAYQGAKCTTPLYMIGAGNSIMPADAKVHTEMLERHSRHHVTRLLNGVQNYEIAKIFCR